MNRQQLGKLQFRTGIGLTITTVIGSIIALQTVILPSITAVSIELPFIGALNIISSTMYKVTATMFIFNVVVLLAISALFIFQGLDKMIK